MTKQYNKFVDYTKLIELASNYSKVDILEGKVKGKGTGALRKWENRLRVVSYTAGKSQFTELDKEYDIMMRKADSYYLKKIMKQPGREVGRCFAMAKIALQNELMPYSSNSEIKQEVKTNYQSEDTKGYHTEDEKEALTSKNRGGSKLATATLIAALGVSSLFGSFVRGCYDEKIIREKDRRIEQLVQEKEKPRMLIRTDLSSAELDKRYEEYAKQEKEGKLPILDLTYTKSRGIEEKLIGTKAEPKKDKEIWGNAGYIYKRDIPEHKKYTSEERAKLKERWANIDEKIKRDTKKLGAGLYDVAKLRHPLSGALRAISGFGGVLNGVARGFVRPIAYFFTRSDKIDKAIDDFADASYFGDSYNELHGRVLGLKVKKTGEFLKEHPIKSTISIAEDVLPFIKWKHSGEQEVSGAGNPPGRSGGAGGSIPGRSGGAGGP